MTIPLLDKKQISVINWMFNYSRIAMIKRNDENTYSDIEKLAGYIEERFPDQSEQILELFQ